jgi:hypothetical protein
VEGKRVDLEDLSGDILFPYGISYPRSLPTLVCFYTATRFFSVSQDYCFLAIDFAEAFTRYTLRRADGTRLWICDCFIMTRYPSCTLFEITLYVML